jgi:Rod binding domain-containing protein
MSDSSGLGPISAPVMIPLPAPMNTTLQKGESAVATNTKIEKSANEFESILLGSWLQQAESSFGSLPGGDDDGDSDTSKEQFQGMAMQSLGTSMTASGGIGIAKMISKQLHKANDAEKASAAKLHPGPSK